MDYGTRWRNHKKWASFSVVCTFSERVSTHTNTFSVFSREGMSLLRLFHCLCGVVFELLSAEETPVTWTSLVGSTFNIQNFIPHKSQKTKAVPETNRAKEFQRGTAGVPESAKEGATGLSEGSDIGLGQQSQTFEPLMPDQTTLNRVKKRYKAAESTVFSPLFSHYFENPKRGNTLNTTWHLTSIKRSSIITP